MYISKLHVIVFKVIGVGYIREDIEFILNRMILTIKGNIYYQMVYKNNNLQHKYQFHFLIYPIKIYLFNNKSKCRFYIE